MCNSIYRVIEPNQEDIDFLSEQQAVRRMKIRRPSIKQPDNRYPEEVIADWCSHFGHYYIVINQPDPRPIHRSAEAQWVADNGPC